MLGRKTRRVWASLYLRGLLGPGECKSLQPMAVRLKLTDHAQLQHLIASTALDDRPAWTALAHEADRLVSGPDIFFVIDNTDHGDDPSQILTHAKPVGLTCRDNQRWS